MESSLPDSSTTFLLSAKQQIGGEEGDEVKKDKQKHQKHHRSKRTTEGKTTTPSRKMHSPPPPPPATAVASESLGETKVKSNLLTGIGRNGIMTKGFDVIVRGVLEGAECHTADALFARTYWVHGRDWTPISTLTPANNLNINLNNTHAGGHVHSSSGTSLVRPLDRCSQAEVITQLAIRSEDPFSRFTWAAPFELALHSSNPHGWPQIVVTLHTVTPGSPTTRATDGGGAPCVSYSRCFVPMRSGHYRRQLPLMQLQPATRRQAWIEWWTCERAELRDPAFLCSGEDRSVLRAAPLPGHVALSLSVTVRGMAECGMEP
ncbi:B9 protein domain 1 [Trypanosoma theileri]|uniref:B9 domain-containing protein 1 n=1 Tax=Trypanosoma theileri TaxID=67003 RepID=A0A1X0P6K0_9TRYP|nr:B9 protein domain 1 [Trypanosoma theileri]ORC92556.1 B9 protein domain 1 [Trypanosoma theileri]